MSLRVLIIEDDEISRMALAMELEDAGYSVQEAANVRSALQISESFRPQVAFVDVKLPDGSGLDLYRELREKYDTIGICFSGYDNEEMIARFKELGFRDWVVKPSKSEKLLAIVSKIAAEHRVR